MMLKWILIFKYDCSTFDIVKVDREIVKDIDKNRANQSVLQL